MGVRILAIIAALILALLSAGFAVGSIDSIDLPTCGEVDSGEAEPNEDGECSDTGKTAKSIADIIGIGAAVAFVLATLSLFAFGFTGRGRPWLRRTGILAITGLALLALTFAVTHV
jgi:hypothetical protein